MPQTSHPFDVRVVNSLERPTINDFNLAQAAARTSAQTLAQIALDLPGYVGANTGGGFYGDGFQVLPGSGWTARVNAGYGFVYHAVLDGAANIGGITGVDVFGGAEIAVPLVLTGVGKDISLSAAPTAGYARRDVIAVRRVTEGSLSEYTTTDIFNPVTQVFGPTPKPKTFTWSLDDAAVETLPAGGAVSASAPFVYVPGIEAPYTQPDNFLSIALPTIPSGYMLLAVINVMPESTVLQANMICDFRSQVLPGRNLTFALSFVGGSSDGITPGSNLTDYNQPKLPGNSGVPILTKTGLGTSNRYALTIPGFFNMRSIAATLSAGGPVYDGNPAFHTFANMVTTTEQRTPEGNVFTTALMTEADTIALADPAISQPAGGQFAVGQPYCRIAFALGYTDLAIPGMNYQGTAFDSAGTTTRTISGTVTLSY